MLSPGESVLKALNGPVEGVPIMSYPKRFVVTTINPLHFRHRATSEPPSGLRKDLRILRKTLGTTARIM